MQLEAPVLSFGAGAWAADMSHTYSVGQYVYDYDDPPVRHAARRGPYKIIARLSVEASS